MRDDAADERDNRTLALSRISTNVARRGDGFAAILTDLSSVFLFFFFFFFFYVRRLILRMRVEEMIIGFGLNEE